ncbi:MAG: hypothetical protein HOJ16_07590 [Candidatus Peribacter sp.]|nr:hypothetical protein [Candidatus Peribacter sp.]MDB4335913.1 hypothetical protein [bacterium]
MFSQAPKKLTFYSFTPNGDMNRIEVRPTDEGVVLVVGDKEFSFDIDSAVNLADAIIDVAGDVGRLNDFQ